MQQLLVTFWQQHGAVGVIFAWVVLSAALNIVFRLKSPEEWVTWADKNPKMHIIIQMIKTLGVDPAAALQVLQDYADKKAKDAGEAKKG